MRRRAEQVDRTRQRITEAAVRLHTTVGPAHTSIAAVAAEAGVTRLTVYRHFDDIDALFEACMAHWAAANPPPNARDWLDVHDPGDRATGLIADIYAWYRSVDDDLHPIYRDWEVMPASARDAAAALTNTMSGVLLAGIAALDAEHQRVLSAIARHLVGYQTWRSLVVHGGLSHDEAVSAAVSMLLSIVDKRRASLLPSQT